MKYLEGFRNKQKKSISRSNLYKDLVPSSYIIIEDLVASLYSDSNLNPIIFGRIIGLDHVEPDVYGADVETVLKISVINFIKDDKNKYYNPLIGSSQSFNIHQIKILFTSILLKETEQKYKELIEEWEIKQNANKYNL